MKKTIQLLVFIVCCNVVITKSQTAEFAPVVDYLQQSGNYQATVGVILRAPLGDDVSLNYRFAAGYKTGGGIYLHGDAGPYFGIRILAAVRPNTKALGWISFLSIILPEGLGYYPDDKHNLYIAVNPLDIDYWHRRDPHEENSRLCGTLEASYKLSTSKSIPGRITPYFALNMMYNPADEFKRWGVRAGIAWIFSNDASQKTQQSYEYQ